MEANKLVCRNLGLSLFIITGLVLGCSNPVTGNTGQKDVTSLLDAPENLRVTAENSTSPRVTLNWTPVSGAVYYVVERSTGIWSNDYVRLTSTHTTTVYIDSSSSLRVGSTYSYRVAAKKQYASDPIGNLSVPVEVYIGEFISNTTDRAPLPAPSNITATVDLSYSSPRVTLIWTMVTDATYYEIYRGTDAEFSDYICLAANHGGTSIYTDTTGLQAGTIYYYKIGAKRYSNDPVELSAPIAARIGVSSITGLNATSLSESSIKLSWSPSPAHGIMGYKVYRALNTSSNFETIATVNTPTIEYIDTLLLAYTRYYYKISPVDSNENEGPLSSSTYATTQASTIAPNNITASSNGQIITLSWEEIQGASIYNIYIGFSAEGPYALVNSLSSIGTVYHVSSLNGTVLTANTTYFFKIGTGGDMSTVTAFATTGP